jgi:hypothetical protein
MLKGRRRIKSLRVVFVAIFAFVSISVSTPRTASAYIVEVNTYLISMMRLFGMGLFHMLLLHPIFARITTDPLSHGEIRGNGIDGSQTVLYATLPIPVREKLTLGVFGGIADNDLKWDRFATKIDGDMDFVGGFVILEPVPDTRLKFSYSYSKIDATFESLGSTGAFDADIHTFNGEISRRFHKKRYWLEPLAGFLYGKANRESFVDTLWAEKTPHSDLKLKRFFGGVTLGVPVSIGYTCSENDPACRSGLVFARAMAFHERFSGIGQDPEFPDSERQDDSYLGFSGTLGADIPVCRNVSVGSTVTKFSAGDQDGYKVMAFVNITDLWSTLGGLF